jgi:hypothetical protein
MCVRAGRVVERNRKIGPALFSLEEGHGPAGEMHFSTKTSLSASGGWLSSETRMTAREFETPGQNPPPAKGSATERVARKMRAIASRQRRIVTLDWQDITANKRRVASRLSLWEQADMPPRANNAAFWMFVKPRAEPPMRG